MLQVTALSHMPFMGQQRKPGDKISEADWLKASDAARAALVNQGHVRVGSGETDARKAAVVARSEAGEYSTDVVDLLQGISAKLDRLLSLNGLEVQAPVRAAAPAKKAPGKKRRRAKAKKRSPAPTPALAQD